MRLEVACLQDKHGHVYLVEGSLDLEGNQICPSELRVSTNKDPVSNFLMLKLTMLP